MTRFPIVLIDLCAWLMRGHRWPEKLVLESLQLMAQPLRTARCVAVLPWQPWFMIKREQWAPMMLVLQRRLRGRVLRMLGHRRPGKFVLRSLQLWAQPLRTATCVAVLPMQPWFMINREQ